MVTDVLLKELLKLPASDRADLAMALWESLTDAERDAEVVLTDEQKAELDRRWDAYVANPGAAASWDVVKDRLKQRLKNRR